MLSEFVEFFISSEQTRLMTEFNQKGYASMFYIIFILKLYQLMLCISEKIAKKTDFVVGPVVKNQFFAMLLFYYSQFWSSLNL